MNIPDFTLKIVNWALSLLASCGTKPFMFPINFHGDDTSKHLASVLCLCVILTLTFKPRRGGEN